MPSRMACVAILVFWVYAAFALFRRDILPDLVLTPPPDFRSIARAEAEQARTRWDLQVAEDAGLTDLHSVGQATTESRRRADGTTVLSSTVQFDSEKLLRGTPFQNPGNEKVTIINRCEIDRSGDLALFEADCRSGHRSESFVRVVGKVRGRELQVQVSSPAPLPMLNRTQSFPYTPRGIVENSVGPIDRMPGLQVGQRWESRVVNPLTGMTDSVTVEVTGKHAIHWGNGVVTTLEVVHHLSPTLSARTWVRRDGLVLRQEVPFPFVRLILERIPEAADLDPGENKLP